MNGISTNSPGHASADPFFFSEMLGNRNSLFLALPWLSVPNGSTLKSSKHVPHRAFAPLGKTGKIQSQMFGLVKHNLPLPQSAFAVLIFRVITFWWKPQAYHLMSNLKKNPDKRNANSSFAVLNYSFQQGHLNKGISCWLMSYRTWLCRCRNDGNKTWRTKQDKVNMAHLNNRKGTLQKFIVSFQLSLILQCSATD